MQRRACLQQLLNLREERLNGYLLFFIVLLGGGLRFWQIGNKPLWLDEAFSLWLARHPWPDMLRWLVQIDQHPPLYYTLLGGWLALGTDEATLRALSALLSTLTIPLIFVLGRALLDTRVGLLAALLLAVSPFHVWMAQEARMYALLTWNATWAILAFVRLLNRQSQTCRWWVLYVVATILTMLTHNVAIFLPLTLNALVLGFWLVRRAGLDPGVELPPLSRWVMAQLVILALWGVWLPTFVVQARGVYAEFWIPSPTWGRVAGVFKHFLSAFLPDRLGLGHMLWSLYAAALGLSWVRLRRRPGVLILLWGLVILPLLGELLVSMKRPILHERTLIWTTLPLYLLLAVGLTQLKRTWAVLLFGFYVSLNIFSLSRYYNAFEKEAWPDAVAAVAAQAHPGDLVLFNATWTQIPFEYYQSRMAPTLQLELHGVPVDLFARGVLEPKMTTDDLPYLQSLLANRERAWLIYSHNWYTDPQSLILSALGRHFARCNRQELVGVQVYMCADSQP